MQKLLLVAGIAVISIAGLGRSHAYEAPWCIKANIGKGWVRDICDFRTFEECLQQRWFYGSTAFCITSRYYVPSSERPGPKRKAQRVDR